LSSVCAEAMPVMAAMRSGKARVKTLANRMK
jgi:hypothetical protein